MVTAFPNLKGIATNDLVESIGGGSFKASYINWSRTLQLMRDNAPEWTVEVVFSPDGGILHKAPVGGYLLLRAKHLDGTTGPEVPQAVMDSRNNSIAFDRITSRDITDTHRRGACMCLAYTTGLAGELWAKMPLESGYASSDDDVPEKPRQSAKTSSKASAAKSAPAKTGATEGAFIAACLAKGLNEKAAKSLIPKLNGDFENGLKTIAEKDEAFVAKINSQFPDAPGEDY